MMELEVWKRSFPFDDLNSYGRDLLICLKIFVILHLPQIQKQQQNCAKKQNRFVVTLQLIQSEIQNLSLTLKT